MARRFFITAHPSVVIDAERFDPLIKPWPSGVVDDATSSTKYSVGGGLNAPGHEVTPGDWIVTDAQTGDRVPVKPDVFDATYTSLAETADDPLALEKFLRRVPRPTLTIGAAAGRVTLRLTSIDQSEVLEGFVDGNTFTVTPAPRTTNV